MDQAHKLKLKMFERFLQSEKETEGIALLVKDLKKFKYCPLCGGELYKDQLNYFCDEKLCTVNNLELIYK